MNVPSWIDTYHAAHDIAGWPRGEAEWWNRRALHDGTLRYLPKLDGRKPTYLDYIVDGVIGDIAQHTSIRDNLPEIWAGVEALVLETLNSSEVKT